MTRTRTHAKFTVGEKAPKADEVLNGAPVINKLGNIALTLAEGEDLSGSFDAEADPPVLQLDDMPVRLEFGYTTTDGDFVGLNNELSVRHTTATGTYTGPGSILRVY